MNEYLFNLGHNDTLGRYAKASRDIRPGELILKERPLFICGPITGVHQCFKCSIKLTKDVYVCGRCNVATICSKKCKGDGHTRGECDALKSNKVRPGDIVNNPQIIPSIRCLLTKKYDEDSFNEFMQLESHLSERRNTRLWNFYENKVVNVIREIGGMSDEEVKDEIIEKICGILDVNTFEVRPAGTIEANECMRGIYLKAALMSHDCIGNTFLSVDEDYLLTIHAASFIREGEPIYYNYANSLMNSYERRIYLKEGKYFECNCKRCMDPIELGTYMSSIYCPKCKSGLLVTEESSFKAYENDSIWFCNNCKEKSTGKFIDITLNGCRNYITFEGTDTVERVESTLKRFADILSPNHSLMLDMKQNLITMYEHNKLTKETFERKLELCNEIVRVLKIIEPEISRLTAIAMHELSATKVCYADYLLNNREVDQVKYVDLLKEAEETLEESIKILVYEPHKSPEGRLFQQALFEMKTIKRLIEDITE